MNGPVIDDRRAEQEQDSRPPHLVEVPLASAVDGYLRRLQELGAVEGADGEVGLHPALAPVLEALHHLLAGGEVAVHVTRPGVPAIVEELRGRVDEATREVNQLQSLASFTLTTTV
ncbi:hypothetical protein LZ198_10525 [Myxococcus sp. K15C18031901]|uniref:hypothetical protein n=1 Tax=Myxococcus dinghuensis TaxID=2906761 RepID=UPI0020A74117|nr:hypothetical protein [Myxococcus dinghuensis]MCP3099306.1 hypothetical protein [Myxococcus dinghuensis]